MPRLALSLPTSTKRVPGGKSSSRMVPHRGLPAAHAVAEGGAGEVVARKLECQVLRRFDLGIAEHRDLDLALHRARAEAQVLRIGDRVVAGRRVAGDRSAGSWAQAHGDGLAAGLRESQHDVHRGGAAVAFEHAGGFEQQARRGVGHERGGIEARGVVQRRRRFDQVEGRRWPGRWHSPPPAPHRPAPACSPRLVSVASGRGRRPAASRWRRCRPP